MPIRHRSSNALSRPSWSTSLDKADKTRDVRFRWFFGSKKSKRGLPGRRWGRSAAKSVDIDSNALTYASPRSPISISSLTDSISSRTFFHNCTGSFLKNAVVARLRRGSLGAEVMVMRNLGWPSSMRMCLSASPCANSRDSSETIETSTLSTVVDPNPNKLT